MNRLFILTSICSISLLLGVPQKIDHSFIESSLAINAPIIEKVVTHPSPSSNGWVVLPEGSGEIMIMVHTEMTNRVKLWLVPTGSNVWHLRQLLDEKISSGDNWRFDWNYQDRPYLHHLVIEAVGPGGTSSEIIKIYKEKSKGAAFAQ